MNFHGSYRPQDVRFLLTPIDVRFVQDASEKERLIQSGRRHYSEMLTPEQLPSRHYLDLFHRAHALNRSRMAAHCITLARAILAARGPAPTIVSLARAGTPVGAILAHLLRRMTAQSVPHYSISIIRDRGIDMNALRTILSDGCPAASIAFVDGWTGKGVIRSELQSSIRRFNALGPSSAQIRSDLFVLSDLAGCADYAASNDDYLIPSSILNATISGLVSRSILNERIGPADYHGCVYFNELRQHDLSTWFVDDIILAAEKIGIDQNLPFDHERNRAAARSISTAFLSATMSAHRITDRNLVKPGIGEATRVLLRRQADRLILRDRELAEVEHLVALAQEKRVPIEIEPSLPYLATAIIRSACDA